MLNLYLEKWGLSTPHLLTETATSHIYTVTYQSEIAILKLLKPIGVDDEAGGAIALRHFDGCGAVRLIQADDQAHLLEYANSNSLINLVERGDDDGATNIIADVVNQLHSRPLPQHTDGLISLRRRFRSLFRHSENPTSEPIFKRASQLADQLLSNPHQICVLHGDIHHENIRHHPKRGWLAFDPKGLIGERTYDVANVLCNPINIPDLVCTEARLLKQSAILADELKVSHKRVLAFVYIHASLSLCWSMEDGMMSDLAMCIAQLTEYHIRDML
ncbi:MAG: hypothetical protein MUE54_04235 [Anaerolineae bacterium]|nr:hypothetical protein [Anaerolineae bacterium]